METTKTTLLFALSCLLLAACNKDPEGFTEDTETPKLVAALDQELSPLTPDPLAWANTDLTFLDEMAGKSIIGMGEATHGTSEFFNSKYRIFKYLVENHGYKVFAIEADFGESLLINDAVQRGASDEIEGLMKTKMHFWTWRTEEVKRMLLWMCEYNKDKVAEDRLQYLGFDCQFNTHHPGMVKDFLRSTGASFASDFEQLLDEAFTATNSRFNTYNIDQLNVYLGQFNALKDSIDIHSSELINASSQKEYELHAHLVNVIMQASKVAFYGTIGVTTVNYRDQYMAENVLWWREYFENERMALWAHNFHVGRQPESEESGSMGFHLDKELGSDYSTIAFAFSQGTFTAVGYSFGLYSAAADRLIETTPAEGSLNFVFYQSSQKNFAVSISQLEQHDVWFNAFKNGLTYLQIGSTYDNYPSKYYSPLEPDFYDIIIYFDKSTASSLL